MSTRTRRCEDIFNKQFNKDYIQVENFGVRLPDGSVTLMVVDITGEVEDSEFVNNCEGNVNCRYVDINHEDRYYGLISKDYYFTNKVAVCFSNTKESEDEIDKLVYFKNGQWNSLGSLMKKCSLLGKAKKINDNEFVYPINLMYKEEVDDMKYKTVVSVRKKYISNNSKFWIMFKYYSIEEV
jgi:hypothetical protein